MDAFNLRAAFPVLETTAYLNAGTFGPVPAATIEACSSTWQLAATSGRSGPPFGDHTRELATRLRAAYAALLGASASDVALTTSTTDSISRVLTGLDLGRGDEVLTADHEHPGMLGPLAALRDQRGVSIRAVPLDEIADAVSARTRLVACSHVAWSDGALAPAALAQAGVPILYDGAQAVGAVPIDLEALGAAFYAGPGQKWLCGPGGLGMLWVSPAWRDRLAVRSPAFDNLSEPLLGLDSPLREDASRFDAPALDAASIAGGIAAHDVIAAAGWPDVHDRAIALAATLARELVARGHAVADRGPSTLVAWDAGTDEQAVATRDRLAAAGVIVRDLPGMGRLRASVGAWNDDADLERLLAALA